MSMSHGELPSLLRRTISKHLLFQTTSSYLRIRNNVNKPVSTPPVRKPIPSLTCACITLTPKRDAFIYITASNCSKFSSIHADLIDLVGLIDLIDPAYHHS